MTAAARTLTLSFPDADAFETEYAANLMNGGVFVASDEPFELREHVRVDLLLESSGKSVTLLGEVVHVLTPDMAQMGAKPGVAVQFEGAASVVRTQLEPLRMAAGVEQPEDNEAGQRRSPRKAARVAAEIELEEGRVAGITRNLSQNGVLVSVNDSNAPVGESVRLALRHPHSGEEMEVDGVIVRNETRDGTVHAVAVEFVPQESDAAPLADFVSNVQAAEHARRLGGILGDIAELGIQNVMQMFAAAGREGTLTLRSGELEGTIGFEQGLLRFCRVGGVAGMKALVRLLHWDTGSFEFHSTLDPVESSGAPLPFDAALLEALRMMDEEAAAGPSTFAPDAQPRLVGDPVESDLSKTEAAVIDLVRAGFSVERMIAVIPEPDPEIQRALSALQDQGIIDV